MILTNGPVQPGDTFRGSLFYDPDAAVISFQRNGVSGQVTDYIFSPGGAGIELHVSTATGIITFRSDASAMSAEVMDNFSDGTAPPIDRFYLQSFPSALFPSLYERNVERFFIDLVDSDLALVNSTALPTNLKVPSNGYAFVGLQGGTTLSNLDYNAAGTIQTLTAISGLKINIDIKPGSNTNPINPKSRGVIPVAVLTTSTFDAAIVDLTTVLFGRTGTEAAPVHSALEDVNGDNKIDLILHFNTQDTGIRCGDTSASLTGETLSGQSIEGSDSIQTVGCK